MSAPSETKRFLEGDVLEVSHQASFTVLLSYMLVIPEHGIFFAQQDSKNYELLMRILPKWKQCKNTRELFTMLTSNYGPPEFSPKDIISYKELRHPLAFRLFTRNRGLISLMYTRRTYKNRLKDAITDFVTLEYRVTAVSPALSRDPILTFSSDLIVKILSYLDSFIDLKSVLLVSTKWYAAINKEISPLSKTLVQNQYLEHYVNIDLQLVKKRLSQDALWNQVVALEYSARKIIPQEGPHLQTWRVNVGIYSGKAYFEVVFGPTVSYMQIGWLSVSSDCRPTGQVTKGVGDDVNSWSFDPVRCIAFNSTKIPYGFLSDINGQQIPVKPGDIIGCLLDLDRKEVGFSRNGEFLGIVFSNFEVRGPYYPAITRSVGSRAGFVLHSTFMKHIPERFKGIADGIPRSGILIEAVAGRYHLNNIDMMYY